mgnify:CR=1 FL=1
MALRDGAVNDGAVARTSGRASPFGAFLDSTFDRLGEAAGRPWVMPSRSDRIASRGDFSWCDSRRMESFSSALSGGMDA